MVLEYSDTLGVIPSQSIHEKETLHSGSSVPGPDGILAGYHGGIWRSTWTILWILALLFWQKVPALDAHGFAPVLCELLWPSPHSSILDGFRPGLPAVKQIVDDHTSLKLGRLYADKSYIDAGWEQSLGQNYALELLTPRKKQK